MTKEKIGKCPNCGMAQWSYTYLVNNLKDRLEGLQESHDSLSIKISELKADLILWETEQKVEPDKKDNEGVHRTSETINEDGTVIVQTHSGRGDNIGTWGPTWG